MFLDLPDGLVHMRVLALMTRAANSEFFESKPGSTVHVTNSDFNKLMMRSSETDPEMLIKNEQLNAQYEFEDGVPKKSIIVKFRDGIDRESADSIKYELLNFAPKSFQIMVDDVWKNADFFVSIEAPFKAYLVVISSLMLILSFFTMTV